MTKSYLMENQQSTTTTPAATTTTTTTAAATNSTAKCLMKKTTKSLASFTGNGTAGFGGDTNQHRFNNNNNNHHHHHHHQHNQQKHQVMDHDSPEWLNGVCHLENHGMSSMLTNIGIGGDEHALLTTTKNIMNTMPSAYLNGNGVRTTGGGGGGGRRRHFSQQQTGIHAENNDCDGDENNHNNNDNNGNNNDENNRNSKGDQQPEQLTTNNNNNNNKEYGINNHSNNNKNHNNNNKMETEIIQAATKVGAINETKILFDKSKQHSASIMTTTTNNKNKNNSSSIQPLEQPERFVSADYSNNDLSMYDSYDNGQKQWIDRLAKGIAKVLRVAKETRRLKCTELLVPRMLATNIAEDVIEMAECEPCGLRGCLLLIFIENNDNQRQKSASNNTAKNNTAVTLAKRNGNSSPSPPPPLSASRLLGEFAIDSNVVPTFEVFLTLKRVEPSWLESLENRFFNKTPIILSEVYLLNKKKLYQPGSPIL